MRLALLSFEKRARAAVLPQPSRFARQEWGHFANQNPTVTGASTFVIEQPFRAATALPDGPQQIAPGCHSVIGRIEHPPANERAAHQPEEIGALDDKRIPKHLHLKISQGMADLPQRIKAKAEWLRVSPNALVMARFRDCLAAMDDPKKALVPPAIAVEFWAVSHAKHRPKANGAAGAMVLETYEAILRGRSGPILDTIIRLALAEQWDATLEQILRDADVITKSREMKSSLGPLRR